MCGGDRPGVDTSRGGSLHMPYIIIPKPGQDCCDFCAAQPVVKIYACWNFTIPGTKDAVFAHESIGGWAACADCSRFVDKRKWTKLTGRAVRRFLKLHNLPSYEAADLREQFREIHKLFKKNMIPEKE